MPLHTTQRFAFPCALLFLFSLLHLSSLSPTSAAFSNRISDSSQLFLYTFQEGQTNSAATATVDLTGRNLIGNLLLNTDSSSWIQGSIGIRMWGGGTQNRVVSASTIANLISSGPLGTSYTLEAWIQPSSTSQADPIIFGFGNWGIATSDPACSSINNQDNIVVRQLSTQVNTGVLSSFSGSQSCINTVNAYISASSRTHVLVTSDGNTLSLYVNGALAGSQAIGSSSVGWFSSNRLFVAPTIGSNNQTWQGDLFLLSMYNRLLSSSEITTNYQAGLPNSIPAQIPVNQTVISPENTVTPVAAIFYGYDGDGDSLVFEIITVPVVGYLYSTDPKWGNPSNPLPIISGMTPYTFDPNNPYLSYGPPEYYTGSAVANFKFTVSDGISTSQVATVTFDVIHVTQPPVALDVSYPAYAGQLILMTLNGYDEDPTPPLNAPMQAVTILNLPSSISGTLFQWTNTGRGFVGDQIRAPGTNITDLVGYRVWYETYSNQPSVDVIRFNVIVKNTTCLNPGTATINIAQKLFITPNASVIETSSVSPSVSFTLAGYDAVSNDGGFSYIITQLPSYGSVTWNGASIVPWNIANPSSSATLMSNGNVVYTSSQSRYQGLHNRANDPQPDYFLYTIIDSNYVFATPERINVTFAPIIHAPVLTIPSPPSSPLSFTVSATSTYNLLPSVSITDFDLPSFPPTPYNLTITINPSWCLLSFPSPLPVDVNGGVDLTQPIIQVPDLSTLQFLLSGLSVSPSAGGNFILTISVSREAAVPTTSSLSLSFSANEVLPPPSPTGSAPDPSSLSSSSGGFYNFNPTPNAPVGYSSSPSSSFSQFMLSSEGLAIWIPIICAIVLFGMGYWERRRRQKKKKMKEVVEATDAEKREEDGEEEEDVTKGDGGEEATEENKVKTDDVVVDVKEQHHTMSSTGEEEEKQDSDEASTLVALSEGLPIPAAAAANNVPDSPPAKTEGALSSRSGYSTPPRKDLNKKYPTSSSLSPSSTNPFSTPSSSISSRRPLLQSSPETPTSSSSSPTATPGRPLTPSVSRQLSSSLSATVKRSPIPMASLSSSANIGRGSGSVPIPAELAGMSAKAIAAYHKAYQETFQAESAALQNSASLRASANPGAPVAGGGGGGLLSHFHQQQQQGRPLSSSVSSLGGGRAPGLELSSSFSSSSSSTSLLGSSVPNAPGGMQRGHGNSGGSLGESLGRSEPNEK